MDLVFFFLLVWVGMTFSRWIYRVGLFGCRELGSDSSPVCFWTNLYACFNN